MVLVVIGLEHSSLQLGPRGEPPRGTAPADPGTKVYVDAAGVSQCTPTTGTCPFRYVLTLRNGQQFCTPQQIK
jgi:hypothetical protein